MQQHTPRHPQADVLLELLDLLDDDLDDFLLLIDGGFAVGTFDIVESKYTSIRFLRCCLQAQPSPQLGKEHSDELLADLETGAVVRSEDDEEELPRPDLPITTSKCFLPRLDPQ